MVSIINDGFINQSYSVILCCTRYKNHIVHKYIKIYFSTKNKINPKWDIYGTISKAEGAWWKRGGKNGGT